MGFSADFLRAMLEARAVERLFEATGLCRLAGSDSLFEVTADDVLSVASVFEIANGLPGLCLSDRAVSSNCSS